MTSQTLSSTNGHRSATTTNGHNSHISHNGSKPCQQSQPTAPTSRPSVIQMLREADAADRARGEIPSQAAPTDHTTTPPFGGFSPQQIEALSAPLNRAHISSREQGRGRVSYLQSFVVLQEANRIFGFDGWQRQTLLCRCVAQAERLIGREQKPGWGVTYIARVRITVSAGAHGSLIREGTGAGHGIDTDLGLAHESAIKEAETDATKRALVTFGNPFGLALYDKSQAQVSGGQRGSAPPQPSAPPAASQGAQADGQPSTARPAQPSARPALQRPSHPAAEPVVWHSSRQAISAAFNGSPKRNGLQGSATSAPTSQASGSDAPLEPTAIAALQERLRALAPGHREAFSRSFRSAFQVPEATPSVAGLIKQERHRIWIEEFLAKAAGG
ncbi:MAG: Rad52/Rad22 family DNA repair protein [Cyanobacteriota bacterium]|jgi:hypothetical protein